MGGVVRQCHHIVYTVSKVGMFSLLALLIGSILALVWGLLTGIAEFLGTYICIPVRRCNEWITIHQLIPIVLASLEMYKVVVKTIFGAMGACFSAIKITRKEEKDESDRV